MTTIKKVLRIVLTLFWYPALIIHELSHAIMALLFFQIPTGIEFFFPLKFNKPLEGAVNFDDKEKTIKPSFSNLMMNLSPFFSVVVFIILSFIFPFFRYIVCYQVLAFNYTLPSNQDLNQGLPFIGIRHKFIDYKKDRHFFNWLYPEWAERQNKLKALNELELQMAKEDLVEESKKELELKHDDLFKKTWIWVEPIEKNDEVENDKIN